MEWHRAGVVLMILGGAIFVLGLLLTWGVRLPLGRLPGDIVVERQNFRLHIPITTCLLISAVASAILILLSRLLKK
ncbi:MAG: DUF2905 domain-containing protein [Planctomycetota bacterium]|nr:MAG: DUF2905 domain-containing protein [Planctomycetota bacterium]